LWQHQQQKQQQSGWQQNSASISSPSSSARTAPVTHTERKPGRRMPGHFAGEQTCLSWAFATLRMRNISMQFISNFPTPAQQEEKPKNIFITSQKCFYINYDPRVMCQV